MKDRSFSRGWIVVGLATLMYLYLLFPSFIIVPISFGNRVELAFPPQHYSLDLYRDYFNSADWLTVTGRSALYAALAASLAMLVGLPAGYALTRTTFPGKRLLVMLLLSPMMVPVVVISLGLYLYYLKLSLTGTVIGIVLAHAMYVTPFIILTISAGVENIDERLEKVAGQLRRELSSRGFSVLEGITPIVPVVIENEEDLCHLCKALLEEGIYINPVLRPAAAHNLLRISCTAAHTDAHVDRLVSTLERVAKRLNITR